jgi:hypothetical protein
MTIYLTPEQSALYDEGGWSSWRIEETVIEDMARLNITAPVIVRLDTGALVFAVVSGVIQ